MLLAVAAAGLSAGCGNSPAGTSAPASTSATGAAPQSSPTGLSGPLSLPPLTRGSADWTTYMGDPQRSGVGPQSPVATTAHRRWTAAVDGDVFAQPLVAAGSVVVATEQDSVYSLDAGTGAVRWRAHLGEPVPHSALVCGRIDSNGITGTPVVDAAAGVVYAVAFFDGPARHELYALRLADGGVVWHRAVDAPGADPRIHQQRGALNLSQGRVYITYGGFTGDCGSYHGRVVAAPVDGTGPLLSYTVDSELLAGIWAPPGAVVSAAGDVWVSTGNTLIMQNDRTQYDRANAVVRLSPTLQQPDFWAPSNWATLNAQDVDLGSVSPALLADGLAFSVGKLGRGYLIRQSALGGIGGDLYDDVVCRSGGATGGAFGGVAVAGSAVFVPCVDGLTALRIQGGDKPSYSVAWRAAPGAGTATLAYGLVWTVASDTTDYRAQWTGSLVGLDPATGAERVRLLLGRVPHFPTPAAGAGGLFVAGIGAVYAVALGAE